MKKITIDIEDMQERLLIKYADGNGITKEEYASNIVKSWLAEHIKGSFIKKLANKTDIELEAFLGEVEP